MYLDAMQQIYANTTKVLVDSRQGSNLLYLPLDKIMQMSDHGTTGAADPASAPPANGPATAPATAPAQPSLDARTRDAARTRERETR
jgi:membrane protease subunit HflK